jgi:putative ABC transport system substrate-binding protein
MRRRTFIAGLGSAAAWPLAARAQRIGRRQVGILMGLRETDQDGQARVQTFRQSLADLGWVGAREVRIDVRWAGPEIARQRDYARELVALTPDVLLANSTTATQALREATQTIPVVFVTLADAIDAGVVSNQARPDANVTGFIQWEQNPGASWESWEAATCRFTSPEIPCFKTETGRFSKNNREAIEKERAITESDQGLR